MGHKTSGKFKRENFILYLEIDQYKPPYAGFVNFNPSIDEMLKCVVDNHERPPINPEWRKYQVIFFFNFTGMRNQSSSSLFSLVIVLLHWLVKVLYCWFLFELFFFLFFFFCETILAILKFIVSLSCIL